MKRATIALALSLLATAALAAPGTFQVSGQVTSIAYLGDATLLTIDHGDVDLVCAGFSWCDRFEVGDTASFRGTLPSLDSDGLYRVDGFSVELGDNAAEPQGDGGGQIDADGDEGPVEDGTDDGGDEPLNNGRG